MLLVSVELRVAVAGVTQQWVAKSLARGCVGDQVLRGALDELLTAVCQCVCRAGSSHAIPVFAFLVLCLSRLAARACGPQ